MLSPFVSANLAELSHVATFITLITSADGTIGVMSDESSSVTPAQRRVLEALKRLGEATADELAESLSITGSAVRQHLASLRSAGFVDSTPERGHAGRPSDRYCATDASEQLFGTSTDFAVGLLELVDEEDPKLVDRLFARHRAQLVARSSAALDDMSVEERVVAVTERLDAEGYLADFEGATDGCYKINLHNCPIWAVAGRYPQACAAELGFVQDLIPDASVTRSSHKTDGTHTCTYEIHQNH
jgi:DeoR family suf operon transcriptional repressor